MEEKTSKYPRRLRRHEMRPITFEQVKHLLEAAQEHPLKALLTVAITTGLCRSELLGLHWQDVDVQNEILHVRRMVSSVGRIESAETARTIVLPTIAVGALKEHQQNQEVVRMKAGETWRDLGLVFPNEIGQPFSPGNLWQQYHAFFVDAGHPYMGFHDLRHITLALFVQMGVSIQVIQAIVGLRHHNTSIINLTPVSLAMQKEAMQKWDVLLSEIPFEAHSRTIKHILLHKSEPEEE